MGERVKATFYEWDLDVNGKHGMTESERESDRAQQLGSVYVDFFPGKFVFKENLRFYYGTQTSHQSEGKQYN